MLTASAAIASGRLQAARQALVDARRHWGEQADQVAVGAWFAAIAYVDFLAGHYGAALKDAGYARRVAGADPATIALAARVLGCVELERGYEEAGRRWLAESASTRAGGAAVMAAADLGAAVAMGGAVDEGLELLRRAAETASGAEERAWTEARLARALAGQGRLEVARRALAAARESIASGESGFAWLQAGLAGAELALASAAAAESLAQAVGLLAALAEAGVRSYRREALLARASALGELGRAGERAAALEELRDLSLELGTEPPATRAR